MIEVTLSWIVARSKETGGLESLTAVTEFVLDDSASVEGQEALQDSLLKQLSLYLAETIYLDIVTIAESAPKSPSR